MCVVYRLPQTPLVANLADEPEVLLAVAVFQEELILKLEHEAVFLVVYVVWLVGQEVDHLGEPDVSGTLRVAPLEPALLSRVRTQHPEPPLHSFLQLAPITSWKMDRIGKCQFTFSLGSQHL